MMENSKIVAFRLGTEEYGVPIHQVVSIERMQTPTKIPKVPKHVRGVLDIRQQVIPIADLRTYLMETEGSDGDETRIIVIDVEGRSMGLVVDEAKDVLDIDPDHIQAVDLNGAASESMLGIARHEDRLIILLSLAKLLNELDPAGILQEIQQAAEAGELNLEDEEPQEETSPTSEEEPQAHIEAEQH
ncbi:purine-binding chemotaxis protein CheW [Caldalkalibacillus uzonensis]|uniref:Purine-binding chemotaxis protein CheW n=1 Tax=Caldalkalibacillus uzonensis TaxID=353224 RepID=A0ABU0CU21_9BACI|nr:chemotaxis protein CheW [Caldalkalibacillus uzonensis]MDQ0339921.1 purine-binding chemotaxis protein CheW [Caldalkalibacillus uzonensis]